MSAFDPPRGSGGGAFPFLNLFPFQAPAPKVQRERGHRQGLVLAVCSRKGGVGKTSTAVNLAAGLAETGRRVLLVDADPQGHAGTCVPVAQEVRKEPGLAGLILEPDAELLDAAGPTELDGLDLVPAGPDLGEAETRLSTRIGRETALRQALEVTRTHYDFLVVDCPPSLSPLAIAALTSSDGVIVPCELSPLTVRGLETLVRTLAQVHSRLNPSLKILGLVINRLDGRTRRANAEAMAELQHVAGDLLFESTIRISTALARSQHAGVPVTRFDSRSPIAKDYRGLTAEVLQRTQAKAPWGGM